MDLFNKTIMKTTLESKGCQIRYEEGTYKSTNYSSQPHFHKKIIVINPNYCFIGELTILPFLYQYVHVVALSITTGSRIIPS